MFLSNETHETQKLQAGTGRGAFLDRRQVEHLEIIQNAGKLKIKSVKSAQ